MILSRGFYFVSLQNGNVIFKGRIERLFGTFQDRLISEMRLKNISTKENANRFLHGEFLPDLNPAAAGSALQRKILLIENFLFTSANLTSQTGINLDSIFCIKEERTVQGDNTISYRGRIFQIIPQNGRMSYTRGKVEVQEWTDRTIHVLYKGKDLSVKEIPERPKRLIEKPKRFKLKDFLRKEAEPQIEFCGVT